MANYVPGRKIRHLTSGSGEEKATCDHCRITEQTVPAKNYCKICREFLCMPCSLIHSKARLTQNHKLQDVDTISTPGEPDPAIPQWQKCPTHPAEAIRLFCETHSKLCCLICFTKDHKTCPDIALTSDLSKDIGKNEEYRSFKSGLKLIVNEKETQEQTLKANKSRSESEHDKIIEGIKAIADRAHVHIDLLARKTSDEACKAKHDNDRRMNEVGDSLIRMKTDIDCVIDDITQEENGQHEERLFVAWKRSQYKVQRIKDDMGQMKSKNSLSLLRFTTSEEVEAMLNASNGLGKLKSVVVSVKKLSGKVQTRPCLPDPMSVPQSIRQELTLAVVAIRLGIDFSTCAVSFKKTGAPETIAAVWNNPKSVFRTFTSTAILIKKDGETFDSFGYEAESKYADVEDKDSYYFFRRFTTVLFGLKDVSGNIKIQDITGKELSARKVFVMAIAFMKTYAAGKAIRDGFHSCLAQNDMMFVLTAPVMYNDAAKLFIREAAIEAGLNQDRLVIVHEPEAILISMSDNSDRITNFTAGNKFIVLNVQGTQGEITVYRLVEEAGQLSEVHVASSSDWGINQVNEAFLDLLSRYTGEECITNLRENDHVDLDNMIHDFEMKILRSYPGTTGEIRFRLPIGVWRAAKDGYRINPHETQLTFLDCSIVSMDSQIAKNFFNEPLNSIVEYIRSLLAKPDISDCKGIIMAGKVSNMLQCKVQSSFPNLKIVIPKEPEFAILNGAVLLGHKLSVLK